ncbi:MAG: imidazolonepropionase [Bacteroidetes bacterium]|nr:imidazolonepropionase [Bacteroidota bacterium]
MKSLIKNIGILYGIQPIEKKRLTGNDIKTVTHIENAWLSFENGRITGFGNNTSLPELSHFEEIIDAEGDTVMPGLIDSHTHIIFPKTREEEFKMKIEGKSYEEIAAAGGGILNSAKAMQNMDSEDLFNTAMQRIQDCISMGTVAFELKSGYGLTTETELKILEVATRIKKLNLFHTKRTLLGAHALPPDYKQNRTAYIDKVKTEMIPLAIQKELVDYVDVFCENGFFTPEETEDILTIASQSGLKAKIHVNQLSVSGGVQVGVKCGALTVDHLENIGQAEIDILSGSSTMPVALPGCSFYLNMPYTPARAIIEAGLPLVLASDFNPGSCPSGNLLFVWSLACIKMKLLPEEAFNALTLNAAAALELQDELGSITIGKEASLLFFKPKTTLALIPYHFSMSKPNLVMIRGKFRS